MTGRDHGSRDAAVDETVESWPIQFVGVGKRYGGLDVLRGVDLRCRAGRITAVLGPNGAGKTTLIKILLGLVRPDCGEVRLRGLAVDGDPGYRESLGYMPQLPRFPVSSSARELTALLDDLRDFRGMPDEELVAGFGLGAELDKPFRALSGGTRQKVNAALAFRYGAPVLVMDEPTAGLDPVAARVLKDKLRRVRAEGRTVLLTSHDLGQVQAVADDVTLLLEGRVCYSGSLHALLEGTGWDDLEGAVAALLGGANEEGVRLAAPGLEPRLEIVR